MQIITLTLSDPEWEKVFRIAQQAWPATVLDRQMSRNECCRRLLLAGLDSMPKANLDAHARPLQPPADSNILPKLPVAGD